VPCCRLPSAFSFPAAVDRYRSVPFDLGGQIEPLSHEQPQPQEIIPFFDVAARHWRQNFRPIKKAQTAMIVQTIIDSIIFDLHVLLGAPN